MSVKNLVLELWPKMLSANQIARFFKFEYLQNRLTVRDDFWYDDVIPSGEYTDVATFPVGMPNLAQAKCSRPIRLLDFSNLNISRTV